MGCCQTKLACTVKMKEEHKKNPTTFWLEPAVLTPITQRISNNCGVPILLSVTKSGMCTVNGLPTEPTMLSFSLKLLVTLTGWAIKSVYLT